MRKSGWVVASCLPLLGVFWGRSDCQLIGGVVKGGKGARGARGARDMKGRHGCEREKAVTNETIC